MDHIMGRLQKILEPFKAAENPSSANIFQKDEIALKILMAWPNLPMIIHEPLAFGTVPEHKANQWKHAWKFRKMDFHDLEKATGIESRDLLQEKMNSLIAHQMLYPDGELSRAAQALLSSL